MKYQDLAELLENEKADHANLLEAHKDLASKLLKSIRIVIAEKIARQRASSKLYELSLETSKLKSDKVSLCIALKRVSFRRLIISFNFMLLYNAI